MKKTGEEINTARKKNGNEQRKLKQAITLHFFSPSVCVCVCACVPAHTLFSSSLSIYSE